MLAARRRRWLLALPLVLLVAVLGTELATRVIDVAKGQPWSTDELRASLENECRILSRRAFLPGAEQTGGKESEQQPLAPGTPILQPYTGWEHVITHSLIEREGEYYRSPESKSTYDICILGGSVAQAFGELGAQRLVECLKRDPRFAQRELRVHGFGFGAYKQPQMTMLLAYLFALGHEPDAVIEIDGFNEAALGFHNASLGGHPLYPYLAGWASASKGLRPDWDLGDLMHEVRAAQERASSFAEGLRASIFSHSAFVAHLGLAHIHRLRNDYAEKYKTLERHLQTGSKGGEFMGPAFDREPAALVNLIVRSWEECARDLHGMCAEHGIDYLHVLQPTLHDTGSKTLTEREQAGSSAGEEWIAGVHAVYPRLREAGARLEQRGIAFYDASLVFQEHTEDIYVDLCHFREHGNEIFAEAIAREFLARLPKK
ncbi:MAG: hypothetical protein IPJ19_14695 [Planctomycetes bacterium]|nr:hypothetical protein [Planctomycetota bacterium]